MANAFLAWLPVLALWSAAQLSAWLRLSVRRGALLRRWRDLKQNHDEEVIGVVNLSRRSASYYLALRVGALVRGSGYVLAFVCIFFTGSAALQFLGLVAFVWIEGGWLAAAKKTFDLISREPFVGFESQALAYQFPRHRRGRLWNLRKQAPSMTLATSGFALVLAAGLPLAWQSDTLPSPIPGLYLHHSNLPFPVVSLIMVVAGTMLVTFGIWMDREKRREEMRRESRIPERKPKHQRMVFLRPFGVEELRLSSHPGPGRDGFRLLLPQHSEFLEDVATWLLWSRGEVVAVARPGREANKTLGAAHHSLRNSDQWQAAVSDLIDSATGIVLVPGVTPGVAWEHERIKSDPCLAAKTLFLNSAPGDGDESFLKVLGTSPRQMEELRNRRLLPLGGVLGKSGPKLLCSSLDEDIDIEVAVDWFLRKELPPAQGHSAISRLKSWAEELLSPAR